MILLVLIIPVLTTDIRVQKVKTETFISTSNIQHLKAVLPCERFISAIFLITLK